MRKKTHLRVMKETSGLLTEELEDLQRKLGRQKKMQEAPVDLELEEKLLAKLQGWEKLDQTMDLNLWALQRTFLGLWLSCSSESSP